MLGLIKAALRREPKRPTVAPLKRTLGRLESALLSVEQLAAPVTNHFAPGVYMREVAMPAGSVAIGHEHKTDHYNIVLSGTVQVVGPDGRVETITGPHVFRSGAGVRKAVHCLTDVRWLTVHATEETDLEKLEALLITKSPAFLAHQSEAMNLSQSQTVRIAPTA